MNLIVNRTMKKPGLIDRARTYYLELSDLGLYIIALGKAGQKPHLRSNLVNNAAQALVKGIVHSIELKMEEEIVANEARIAAGNNKEMVLEKKSYFLTKNQISNFNVSNDGEFLKINIKGEKVALTLFADPAYKEEIQAIESNLV